MCQQNMQEPAVHNMQTRYSGGSPKLYANKIHRSQLNTSYANQIFRRQLYTVSKLETDAVETDNGDSIL
jgi:hypothetical protein